MEQNGIIPSIDQTITPATNQTTPLEQKKPYQSPQVITYGLVGELTKGSGGNYDDECTSGQWQSDD